MTRVSARGAMCLAAIAALPLVGASSAKAQAPMVDITSPLGRIASAGAVRIVAQLRAESDEGFIAPVSTVRFFVDDAPVGEDPEGPVYAVEWADSNPFSPVTIRAEAVGVDGLIGVDSVTLPPLDVTDETSVASVLLDVAVMDKEGKYVQKLTKDTSRCMKTASCRSWTWSTRPSCRPPIRCWWTPVRACRTGSISCGGLPVVLEAR